MTSALFLLTREPLIIAASLARCTAWDCDIRGAAPICVGAARSEEVVTIQAL